MVLLLAASPGCRSDGQDGAGASSAAGGAGGTPAGVGGPESPCLDIWVHGGILPTPLDTSRMIDLPRHPLWRDDRGLHFVWVAAIGSTGAAPARLVVSTFDPATGDALQHRVYDPMPAELADTPFGIDDASIAPDGSFAAAIGHGDPDAPDGYAEKVVLGHLDQDSLVATWVSPYSVLEWGVFHLAWDRFAFEVDFKANFAADVLMLRLAPDGSELLGPTEVGSISSVEDYASSFHTDPETGTTWFATSYPDGVWLSGHERDGSPLAGTEPDGAVVIEPQGGPDMWSPGLRPAVAPDGQRALLAWSGNGMATAYAQIVDSGHVVDQSLVLLDSSESTGPYLWDKRLERLDDGWWMAGAVGTSEPSDWVRSYWVGDTPTGGIELIGQTTILAAPPCWPDCLNLNNGLQSFSSLRYQDEIWFGFADHTGPPEPYRIVRVGRSCRYKSCYEIQTEP